MILHHFSLISLLFVEKTEKPYMTLYFTVPKSLIYGVSKILFLIIEDQDIRLLLQSDAKKLHLQRMTRTQPDLNLIRTSWPELTPNSTSNRICLDDKNGIFFFSGPDPITVSTARSWRQLLLSQQWYNLVQRVFWFSLGYVM